jgi:hypothetical protein
MTRTTNSRIAGFMFLFYIATGIASMVLFDQAASGKGVSARLTSITHHATGMRLAAVLSLVGILNPLVLGVALYALTRDYDQDLAVLALSCRVAEGVMNAIPSIARLALLSVATGAVGTSGADAAATNIFGALLFKVPAWSTNVSATLFAAGSLVYSYLFLRARSIPALLARLGILASVALLAGLPMQIAGFITGR